MGEDSSLAGRNSGKPCHDIDTTAIALVPSSEAANLPFNPSEPSGALSLAILAHTQYIPLRGIRYNPPIEEIYPRSSDRRNRNYLRNPAAITNSVNPGKTLQRVAAMSPITQNPTPVPKMIGGMKPTIPSPCRMAGRGRPTTAKITPRSEPFNVAQNVEGVMFAGDTVHRETHNNVIIPPRDWSRKSLLLQTPRTWSARPDRLRGLIAGRALAAGYATQRLKTKSPAFTSVP